MNTYHLSNWQKGIAALGLAVLSLAQPLAAFAQSPRYIVTNLGNVFAINKKSPESQNATAMSSDGSKVVGQVHTVASNGSTTTSSFYWDGAMHPILTSNSAINKPWYVTPSGLVLYQSPPSMYVWTLAGGQVTLPNGGNSSGASCMNDAGIIVGSMDDINNILGVSSTNGTTYARIPARWDRDTLGQWSYIKLPLLPGHNGGGSWRVDSNGIIIGHSELQTMATNGAILNSDQHIVLWSPSDGFIPHDLGAPGINPVVHRSLTDPSTLATQYLYRFGSENRNWYTNGIAPTELIGTDTTTPYMNANGLTTGLTTSGQVSGTAGFAGAHRAFYWDTGFPSGAVMDLGVLPGGIRSEVKPLSQFTNSMNGAGFIVGNSVSSTSGASIYTAVLSTPDSRLTSSAKLLDLNSLLNNTLTSVGLTSLTYGVAISDNGKILCHAKTSGGDQRIALLTIQ